MIKAVSSHEVDAMGVGHMSYPLPSGVDAIPLERLDLRPDALVDRDLLHPPPVRDDKNIWFFWHSGFAYMHTYAQRTVRAWHRRLSRQGWVVRVLDRQPDSPYELLSYNAGYFSLFGQLTGGKTSTEGMHASPLLRGLPLMGGGAHSFVEKGKTYEPDEVDRMLTDYIIQGQVMTMVMHLIDDEDCWNGPRYVAEHVFAIDYMIGSQLINEITAWNGPRQFELMPLQMPEAGEPEREDQRLAREIVEAYLSKSFGFKLAHGLILRVIGDTLGSLWRKHVDTDMAPWTYGHWLRHGNVYLRPSNLPSRLEFKEIEPLERATAKGRMSEVYEV